MRQGEQEGRYADNLVSDTGRVVNAIGRVIERVPRQGQKHCHSGHRDARCALDHLRPPVTDVTGGDPAQQEHAGNGDPAVDAQNNRAPWVFQGAKVGRLGEKEVQYQPQASGDPQRAERHDHC